MYPLLQVKSLVRSLSLKLSRENLAVKESDVETPPPLVEEEQIEVDDGGPEVESVKVGSSEEESTEIKKISSNIEEAQVGEGKEEVGAVKTPAQPIVDDAPPCDEAQEDSRINGGECQEDIVVTVDSETKENVEGEIKENGDQCDQESKEASVSDSERSQTLTRSRSDTDYEGHSHQVSGRPGLQGWIDVSSPSLHIIYISTYLLMENLSSGFLNIYLATISMFT